MTQSAVLATLLILAVGASSAFNKTKSAASTIKAAVAYTSKPTTSRYGSSTIPRHHIGNTYYYYMDSSLYCSTGTSLAPTTIFDSWGDDAYVKAWTYSRYTLPPTGSCSYTFSSSLTDDLKFRFNSLQISDCSVKVKVFKKYTATGTPDYTFSCGSTYSYYSSYRYSYSGYVTIKLENPTRSRNFDFTFYVKDTDSSSGGGTGITIGLSVGLSVGFIIFLTICIAVCRRRRIRMRGGPPLIIAAGATATTATTANYNYPVGQAPYPSYGSAPNYNSPPPPAGAYPTGPAGAYPRPAGGYQKDNPPHDQPTGAAPYPQPPTYNN